MYVARVDASAIGTNADPINFRTGNAAGNGQIIAMPLIGPDRIWRVFGHKAELSGNSSIAGGANIGYAIKDSQGYQFAGGRNLWVPAAATNQLGGYTTQWMDLIDGETTSQPGSDLYLTSGVTFASGAMLVTILAAQEKAQ